MAAARDEADRVFNELLGKLTDVLVQIIESSSEKSALGMMEIAFGKAKRRVEEKGPPVMPFEEFRQMALSMPANGHRTVIQFQKFLASGCSEAEAKIWIGEHIWEFPDEMREGLTMAFASESLAEAARKAKGRQ